MPVLTQTIDTNVLDAVTSELALTSETILTVYVCNLTGTSESHRTTLQVSPLPSGDCWIDAGIPINGEGVETTIVSAERARVHVVAPEGAVSTCTVFIDAR